MLGAIYCSSIFPESSPDGRFLVRVMAGGVLHPQSLHETDQTLTQQAEDMLRAYAGVDAPCRFQRVIRATAAIPQYTIGHSQRLTRIRDLTSKLPNLQLLGNSYEAVSVTGQLGHPGRSQTTAS